MFGAARQDGAPAIGRARQVGRAVEWGASDERRIIWHGFEWFWRCCSLDVAPHHTVSCAFPVGGEKTLKPCMVGPTPVSYPRVSADVILFPYPSALRGFRSAKQ